MPKKSIFLACLAFLATACLSQSIWNSYGCYTSECLNINYENIFTKLSSQTLDEYRVRFNKTPNVMIWKDDAVRDKIQFMLSYTYWKDRFDYPEPSWNDSTLTWGELRQHFVLRLSQVGEQDTTTLPIAWGDPDVVVSNNSDESAGWAGVFDLEVTELPIQDFGTAWSLWIAPIGPAPDPCRSSGSYENQVDLVDTVTFVYTSITTPTDSLLWSLSDWEGRGSIALAHQLFKLFPNNTSLMRTLLPYYYENANCDSVSRIGTHYIDVMRNNLDPFRISYSYPGPSPTISEVERMIQYLCVDGVVKPWRDPSRGF
ncbi:hypothetical protein KQI52_06720 [bacterium]|nr:hypothetical protein [bacterium]